MANRKYELKVPESPVFAEMRKRMEREQLETNAKEEADAFLKKFLLKDHATTPPSGDLDLDLGKLETSTTQYSSTPKTGGPTPPQLPPSGGGSGGGGSGGGSSSGGNSGGKKEPFDFVKFVDKNFGAILGPLAVLAGFFFLYSNLEVERIRAQETPPVKIEREKTAQSTNQVAIAQEATKQLKILKPEQSQNSRVSDDGCTIRNPGVRNMQHCSVISFIRSDEMVRFYTTERRAPVRADGMYRLFNSDEQTVYCQTYQPSEEKYSNDGCAKELRALSYPRKLTFVAYSNLFFFRR